MEILFIIILIILICTAGAASSSKSIWNGLDLGQKVILELFDIGENKSYSEKTISIEDGSIDEDPEVKIIWITKNIDKTPQ